MPAMVTQPMSRLDAGNPVACRVVASLRRRMAGRAGLAAALAAHG
jgi:hypothetical protein